MYLSTHPSLGKSNLNNSKKEYLRSALIDIIPDESESMILEIGPGNGDCLVLLKDDYGFKNIFSIDNSDEVIRNVKAKGFENSFLVDDPQAFLEKHPNSYDLIVMSHVLEHFEYSAVIPLLNSCYKSLNYGGSLVVVVPNVACPIVGVEQQFFDFTHRTPFSPWSLAQVFAMSDFKMAQISNCWAGGRGVLRVLQRFVQRSLIKTLNIFLRAFSGIDRSVYTHSIRAYARKKNT